MASPEALAQDQLRQAKQVARRRERARLQAVASLSALRRRLSSLILETDWDTSRTALQKKSARIRLGRAATEEISTTFQNIREDLEADLAAVAVAQQAGLLASLSRHVPDITLTRPLTDSAMQRTAKEALVVDLSQDEWWARTEADARAKVLRSINRGFVLNEPPLTIAERVRGRGRAKNFTVISRNTSALITTIFASVANTTMLAAMRNQRRPLKGFKAVASLDTTTSELCRELTGGAWKLDGTPLEDSAVQQQFPGPPPWHFNCRTFLVPIVRG